MSPWEKKRPGFRPSQHLWKCSRVTTTKSTCQRPAQWTSSPRLQRLQLPHTPNELVWMSICLLKWKGKEDMRRKKKKRYFFLSCCIDHLQSTNMIIITRHRNTILLTLEILWSYWTENCCDKTTKAINLGLWFQNGTVPVWGASLETDTGEGPQKAVCLLGSLFTFLRVILAPGGEQSRGADMSLGLVSGRRASRRCGGTWTCGWYIKKHTNTHTHTSSRQTTGTFILFATPLFTSFSAF